MRTQDARRRSRFAFDSGGVAGGGIPAEVGASETARGLRPGRRRPPGYPDTLRFLLSEGAGLFGQKMSEQMMLGQRLRPVMKIVVSVSRSPPCCRSAGSRNRSAVLGPGGYLRFWRPSPCPDGQPEIVTQSSWLPFLRRPWHGRRAHGEVLRQLATGRSRRGNTLPCFRRRPSLATGDAVLRGFLSTMTAAARAVPDAGTLNEVLRDNQPVLGDLVQNDPVMYGDLADAIRAAKQTMAENR